MLSVAIVPDIKQIQSKKSRGGMKERIIRRIKRMWPDQDHMEIVKLLETYGTESYERNPERIYLAILKVSRGSIDRLPELVRMAKADWRDVVAMAESPEEMKTGPGEMYRMSKEDARQLRKRDKTQYTRWLEEV